MVEVVVEVVEVFGAGRDDDDGGDQPEIYERLVV